MSRPVASWPARLRLDPTVFLAPGSVVTGDVTIGARSSVWFQTVVRGDSDAVEIGADTNLQDLTLVHQDEGFPARIGSRVTVGHRAVIHGCVIEDDCLIGMGAVLLTGARIGTGSLVAAGALVREGQEVAPGSLVVGAPARVVGPVRPAHTAAIRSGAEHYAALALSYLRRGLARPHPFPDAEPGACLPWRGPMTFGEWQGLLDTLSGSPALAAAWLASRGAEAWRRAPGPGRWSALAVLAHLRDADRDIYLPRLERLLAEDEPRIELVDSEPWARERQYDRQDPHAVLAEWQAVRARTLAALSPLGPDEWRRFGWHSQRGPYPIGEIAREWAEHDLSHRRQIAHALGEPGLARMRVPRGTGTGDA